MLMLRLWMVILVVFLFSLTVWAVFFIDGTSDKILIFGLVGVLITAITSVYSVTINNNKIKERELGLLIMREKQKVYSHFYNSYFEILTNIKKVSGSGVNKKLINELMEFKKGLMNWGSEDLIKSYIEFDEKLQLPEDPKDPYRILRDGDKFLKDLRSDIGLKSEGKTNILSIILDSQARKDFHDSCCENLGSDEK